MNNTKQRNAEIAAAARQVLRAKEFFNIDDISMLELAKSIVTATGCHISTAKRHIRRIVDGSAPAQWGGKREGASAPTGNTNAAKSYPK